MPLIEDANLFMMCPRPHRGAFTPVPHGFSVRPARREEWDTWLTFPFDTQSSKEAYRPFMVDYFNRVYLPKEADFWRACQFLCDATDTPVGTCFLWRAYGTVTTLHWFKVKRNGKEKALDGRCSRGTGYRQGGRRPDLPAHPTGELSCD